MFLYVVLLPLSNEVIWGKIAEINFIGTKKNFNILKVNSICILEEETLAESKVVKMFENITSTFELHF